MGRLLIVEDYPPLANVLGIGLKRHGHVVVRVGSAARAQACEGSFDAAVIDVDLPDGNGVELAEQLIAEQRLRAVVFYTASRDAQWRERAAELGPVLDKSAPMDELVHAVHDELAAWGEVARAVGDGDAVLPRSSSRSGTRRRVR